MTNKEILHADILDILFENRNKTYGAYALRKSYHHRLQWALGISLSFTFLLSIINIRGSQPHRKIVSVIPDVTLRPVDPPDLKKVDPPKPKVDAPKKQVAYTDRIDIVPDNMKTEMPDKTEIDESVISTKHVDGVASSDTVETAKPADIKEATTDLKRNDNKAFVTTNSDAQFPGGVTAFTKFLTRYLRTPDELEAGEKKVVLVRFMVDADGTISKTEVLQSDGDDYTKEVIRVLAKMPRWIPAMQNGTRVATWFTQPVSFIGVE